MGGTSIVFTCISIGIVLSISKIQQTEIMKKHRVIISRWNWGHISFSNAKELEKKHKEIDLLFVGASNRMEMQKVPVHGYNIIGLWISGFQRKFSIKIFFSIETNCKFDSFNLYN